MSAKFAYNIAIFLLFLSIHSFRKNEQEDHLASNGLSSRTLDRLAAGEVLRNVDGEIVTGSDVVRRLLATHALDRISGAQLLRLLDPLSGGVVSRALDRVGSK